MIYKSDYDTSLSDSCLFDSGCVVKGHVVLSYVVGLGLAVRGLCHRARYGLYDAWGVRLPRKEPEEDDKYLTHSAHGHHVPGRQQMTIT